MTFVSQTTVVERNEVNDNFEINEFDHYPEFIISDVEDNINLMESKEDLDLEIIINEYRNEKGILLIEPDGIILRAQCMTGKSLQTLTNINLSGYMIVKSYPFTVLIKSPGHIFFVISSFDNCHYYQNSHDFPWSSTSKFQIRKNRLPLNYAKCC